MAQDGDDPSARWVLETVRGIQRAIASASTVDDLGRQLPGELIEPAENRAAWIGQRHSSGGTAVRASSHGTPDRIPEDGESRTRVALETGTVQFESPDPEYSYLRDEHGFPTAERTVSIPLGTDGGSVVHLYTDGALPADPTVQFETVGAVITTGLERARLSGELDRERGRLEQLRSLVSHDLGNPVNLAAGRLDLVSMECESEHIQHVEKGLDQIEQLAEEGNTFVKVGREVGERKSLSLSAIAADCWEYAGRDRGKLRVEDTTVDADSERLRRVLNELLLNAFVHSDGEIHVEIGPLSDGQGFYVADDGPGIPADEREYVFDRGYTTEPERDGHGLTVVEEIVLAHGWEVDLADAPGTRIEIRTERW